MAASSWDVAGRSTLSNTGLQGSSSGLIQREAALHTRQSARGDQLIETIRPAPSVSERSQVLFVDESDVVGRVSRGGGELPQRSVVRC